MSKADDLKKLADAFYKNLEITPWEFGGIGLDPKRPFGNSDALEDILRIIGRKPEKIEDGEKVFSDRQLAYARKLYHKELIPYLRACRRKQGGNPGPINPVRDSTGSRAKRVLQDILDAMDGPASNLIENLADLRRHWDRKRSSF